MSGRFKSKRGGGGGYPSLPNQPSEASAHFMFELAKTVLTKAGGNSSTSLFTQANQNVRGPHRALHMCAFQIGLYALGLHNRVSPNWLSRTYSSHVSWITGQALDLGVSALAFIIGTWEGHLTPPEAANMADKASKCRDTAMVRSGAELALSVLPCAGALNQNEIQRAIQQCKEQNTLMLENACLAVEKASLQTGGISAEVLFEVARHWYSLYEKELPAAQEQQRRQQEPVAQHQQVHDPQQQQVNNVLLAVAAQQQQQQQQQGGNFPAAPSSGHAPPSIQPLGLPFPVPYLIPSFPAAAAAAQAAMANQLMFVAPPPPPPHSQPQQQQQQQVAAAAQVALQAAAAASFNQVYPAPTSSAAANGRFNPAAAAGGAAALYQLNLAPLLPAPPPANPLQVVHQAQQAMIAAAAAGQHAQVAAAAAAAANVPGMAGQLGGAGQPGAVQNRVQVHAHGPHHPHLPPPPTVSAGGGAAVAGAAAAQPGGQGSHRCLLLAYRVGILALDVLGRKIGEERPQVKFARSPSYGDDVKWLLTHVAQKLGIGMIEKLIFSVANNIISPFLLQARKVYVH